MYPPGHIGIALALYAPVGLVLLLRGRARLAVAGMIVIAGVTLLPDVDKWLPWLVHRGRTHTIWFALVVGGSLGAIAATVGEYRYQHGATTLVFGASGVLVGTLAIFAHLVGDVITPMGVRPLYPLSDVSYTFSLVFASDPTANARLFALGFVATVVQLVLGAGLAPGTPWGSALRDTLRSVSGQASPGVNDGQDSARGVLGPSDHRLSSPGSVGETDD